MPNKTLGCPTAVRYGSYTYPLTPLTPSSSKSATNDCPYVVSIVNERPPVETAVSAIEPSIHVICGRMALKLRLSRKTEPLVDVATTSIGIRIRNAVAFGSGRKRSAASPQFVSNGFEEEVLVESIFPL